MADIADLVIYLSTGRAIAWVGAGPSVDIGLPTWGQLAKIILDKCRRKPNRFLEQIIKYYEDSKFPEMFDQVAIGYGKPFLIDCLSEAIIPQIGMLRVSRELYSPPSPPIEISLELYIICTV